MSSEHASDADTEAVEDEAAAVLFSVFGFDVVLEEEFVSFPWRAGLVRAPVAVLATYLLVVLVAASTGISGSDVAGTLAYVAVIVYGLHHVPVARGDVPEVLEPVARHVVEIPALRGFVYTGANHGDPVGHLVGIVSGETGSIGHVNPLPADPTVPIEVYFAIPVVVLVATGYEFALRYWDSVTVDSVLEVGRFGAAVGAGYVLVLFAGTFVVTLVSSVGVVMPDRYVTLVFGSVYPAVLVSVGALLVYAQKRWLRSEA